MNKVDKLDKEQNDIIDLLNKKLTKKEGELLKRTLDIEYILTMVEEGHDINIYI